MRLIGAMSAAILLVTSHAAASAEPAQEAMLQTYADIALSGYSDALAKAKDLDTAVTAFLASPTDETLKAARQAYVDARPWYQQTEAFRFGKPVEWIGLAPADVTRLITALIEHTREVAAEPFVIALP